MKRNENTKNENFEEEKVDGVIIKIINFIKVISLGFVYGFLIYIFTIAADFITRIILLPFVLCSCCLFWQNIAHIKKNDLMTEMLRKMYIVIFLLYWFGVIGVGAYTMIIDEQYSMTLCLIPFILAGVYVVYDTFFRKR